MKAPLLARNKPVKEPAWKCCGCIKNGKRETTDVESQDEVKGLRRCCVVFGMSMAQGVTGCIVLCHIASIAANCFYLSNVYNTTFTHELQVEAAHAFGVLVSILNVSAEMEMEYIHEYFRCLEVYIPRGIAYFLQAVLTWPNPERRSSFTYDYEQMIAFALLFIGFLYILIGTMMSFGALTSKCWSLLR